MAAAGHRHGLRGDLPSGCRPQEDSGARDQLLWSLILQSYALVLLCESERKSQRELGFTVAFGFDPLCEFVVLWHPDIFVREEEFVELRCHQRTATEIAV
ncbi:hypothetical protein N234_09405 [Ralstonia pickettii DTP0602]|nr:hypothetical protein N234_09405 [Ralstonia pickettii DTP0602]